MTRLNGIRPVVVLAGVALWFLTTQCNPPTTFGEEFVQGREVLALTGYQPRFTVIKDSTITGPFLSFSLGSYLDPATGRVSSGFYSQLLRSLYLTVDSGFTTKGDTTYGTSISVDSCLLTLSLLDRYGRSTDPQRLHLYRVQDPITLISQRFRFSEDSVAVDRSTDFANGHIFSFTENVGSLKIKTSLNLQIATDLLSLGFKLGKPDQDTNFIKQFKGIYITTDPTSAVPGRVSGAVYRALSQSWNGAFAQGSDSININIYFKSQYGAGPIQRRRAVFSVSPGRTIGFSRILRDQTSQRLIDTVVNRISPNAGRNLIITGGSQYKLRINFPSLRDSLKSGLVNSASLVLKVDPAYFGGPGDSLRIPQPAVLNATLVSSDSLSEGVSETLEVYYSTKEKGYVVPISSYVTSVLSGQADYGLALYIRDRSTRATRVVLGGPKHPNPSLRPSFVVYYTPIVRQ